MSHHKNEINCLFDIGVLRWRKSHFFSFYSLYFIFCFVCFANGNGSTILVAGEKWADRKQQKNSNNIKQNRKHYFHFAKWSLSLSRFFLVRCDSENLSKWIRFTERRAVSSDNFKCNRAFFASYEIRTDRQNEIKTK